MPSLAHSMSIGVELARERRVVVLDQASPARQLQHLIIAEHKPAALRFDHFARARALAIQTVNHLHFFAAEPAADDRAGAGFQGGLEDDPFVRRRHALHDCFAQSPGAAIELFGSRSTAFFKFFFAPAQS